MNVTVQIKPLEWFRYDGGWIANSPFETNLYTYQAKVDAIGQVFVNTPLAGFYNYFPSLEAAKQACQQDYETRIASVFSGEVA